MIGNDDVLVVGAGPHALTLAAYLAGQRSGASRLRVVDPSGRWLDRWHHQMAAYAIPVLRSPSVHHPHPDPHELRRHALRLGAELDGSYLRPPCDLFAGFCRALIDEHDLDACVIQDQVTRLTPGEHGSPITAVLADAGAVSPRAVVVAANATRPRIPGWASDAVETAAATVVEAPVIRHSSGIDLRTESPAGQHLLVVGGGLTAAHLAVGAADAGATVHMVSRRPLRTQTFDADPGWLGPRYLTGFEAEPDWDRRREMIRRARNGGSIPRDMIERVRGCGRLNVLEAAAVGQASLAGPCWEVALTSGTVLSVDEIWLATGTDHDVRTVDFLTPLVARCPTRIVGGLPVVGRDLKWPAVPVWLMGALAGLQLGPAAQNLAGARMAAARIVPALSRHRDRAVTAGRRAEAPA